MRQNFRQNKRKKEEMRKKKQEEKRNKRLHKKENTAVLDQGILPTQAEGTRVA